MPFKALQALTLLTLLWFPQSTLKTEYDKFRDQTIIETGRHHVLMKSPGVLKVAAYFSYRGKALTPDRQTIIGLTFYSHSASWRFSRDEHLIVLADGARLDFGDSAESDSRIDRSSGVRETLDYALSPAQLELLAKAEKVEMQLGSVEFKVKDKFLKELRQLSRELGERIKAP